MGHFSLSEKYIYALKSLKESIDKKMNQPTTQEELGRILANSGYEHPEVIKVPNNPYMNYSEKGANPYVTGGGGPYATMDTSQEEKTHSLEKSLCPVCNGKAMYLCDCEYEDAMCKNKHVWYYSEKTRKIEKDDPHKN